MQLFRDMVIPCYLRSHTHTMKPFLFFVNKMIKGGTFVQIHIEYWHSCLIKDELHSSFPNLLCSSIHPSKFWQVAYMLNPNPFDIWNWHKESSTYCWSDLSSHICFGSVIDILQRKVDRTMCQWEANETMSRILISVLRTIIFIKFTQLPFRRCC